MHNVNSDGCSIGAHGFYVLSKRLQISHFFSSFLLCFLLRLGALSQEIVFSINNINLHSTHKLDNIMAGAPRVLSFQAQFFHLSSISKLSEVLSYTLKFRTLIKSVKKLLF